jgi:L-ascorbate metabolism protein UlaG (beta-lactamase superfamily)
MSLAEIEAALQAHPPTLDASPARAKIAASLDRLVNVRVRDDMTDEERARLQLLAEFYRRQADRGLDALERTVVTTGVHVFKFYSSSIVFKSADGVVALDFAQGPINNGGEPEQRDVRRTGFYLTPAQRDRLARLVDVSLITHRHHDHADYSLSKRLLAQGKTVVGPAQLKVLWKDLAAKLTVPDFTRAQTIGPVEFVAFPGSQYSRNGADATGQRVGIPNEGVPGADSETIVYLARIGGLVYLQGGENHVPAADWLRQSVAQGFWPDLRGSTGQFQGSRSVDAVLRELGPAMLLPRHEFEMTHEGGGNRMTPLFTGNGGKALAQRQSLVLFWGEHFPLTRAELPARKQ